MRQHDERSSLVNSRFAEKFVRPFDDDFIRVGDAGFRGKHGTRVDDGDAITQILSHRCHSAREVDRAEDIQVCLGSKTLYEDANVIAVGLAFVAKRTYSGFGGKEKRPSFGFGCVFERLRSKSSGDSGLVDQQPPSAAFVVQPKHVRCRALRPNVID